MKIKKDELEKLNELIEIKHLAKPLVKDPMEAIKKTLNMKHVNRIKNSLKMALRYLNYVNYESQSRYDSSILKKIGLKTYYFLTDKRLYFHVEEDMQTLNVEVRDHRNSLLKTYIYHFNDIDVMFKELSNEYPELKDCRVFYARGGA